MPPRLRTFRITEGFSKRDLALSVASLFGYELMDYEDLGERRENVSARGELQFVVRSDVSLPDDQRIFFVKKITLVGVGEKTDEWKLRGEGGFSPSKDDNSLFLFGATFSTQTRNGTLGILT